MENIEIKFLDVLGGVFTLLKLGNIVNISWYWIAQIATRIHNQWLSKL